MYNSFWFVSDVVGCFKMLVCVFLVCDSSVVEYVMN